MSEKSDWDKGYDQAMMRTNGERKALKARIAELEEKQRWIPVGERLPNNWKPVLTIDMSESTRVPVPAFYDPETSRWSTHFPYDLWVTHWMPLPESPIDQLTAHNATERKDDKECEVRGLYARKSK